MDNPSDQDGLLFKHKVRPPFPMWGTQRVNPMWRSLWMDNPMDQDGLLFKQKLRPPLLV